MKEIAGNNLIKFFDIVDPLCKDADIIYSDDKHEVWKVSDELFEKMCKMPEVEFVELKDSNTLYKKELTK